MSTPQEEKVFMVHKTRFCNLWSLPNTHQFNKDFLLLIVDSEVNTPIEQNSITSPSTFTMKYLAKQLLTYEHHLYIK